jgi:biopolymer transport protein ExbB/TolQ
VDAFTDGMATGFLAAAAGLAVASAAVLAWYGAARAGDPA